MKWGQSNFWGSFFGIAQVGAGIGVIGLSGFIGASVGTGLINSGVNSVIYSLSTGEDKISFDVYAEKAAINGSIGVISAGIGFFGKAAVVVGKLGKTAATVGMNALGGASGQIAGTLTEAALEQKDPEFSKSKILGGAAGYGIVGSICSKVFS